MPFSLLIEQVTGLYLVLLDGGTLVLLPEDMPLVGTAAAAPADVLPHVAAARPTAMVATPALVEAFAVRADTALGGGENVVTALFGTGQAPLVCCGGAPVHPDLLRRLEVRASRPRGLRTVREQFRGQLEHPSARRTGTVGRPLPHVTVRIADDGELLVNSTSLFAGYTRDDPSSLVLDADGWLHTGDLADIDEDGFISITGRKKNVIVTAAGRNVAPEWVEAQYARLPFVRAVAVVGDGLTALHGLFLVDGSVDPAEAEKAVRAFGEEHLSQVERVARPHIVAASETLYRRYFTVTGRPMRKTVQYDLVNGTLHAGEADGAIEGAEA
ncbi:AMP-binding protein [Streptomyces nogalater]